MADAKAARTWDDLTEDERRQSEFCCAHGDCLKIGTIEVDTMRRVALLCVDHAPPKGSAKAPMKRRPRRS